MAECDGLAVRERLAVREGPGDRDGVGVDDGVTAGTGAVGAGAGFTVEPVWAVLAGTGRTRM